MVATSGERGAGCGLRAALLLSGLFSGFLAGRVGLPLFADVSICAVIESWVCFETSPASRLVSSADKARAESMGGVGGLFVAGTFVAELLIAVLLAAELFVAGFAANVVTSSLTPLILPLVKASAKFMRFKSADELTQVSAFME